MGSTETKLSRLAQTKADIKNAIINKGVEIDDTTPFKDYAAKIEKIESAGANTVISGAKIFETEEEMNADTTAKIDDLAVVYRSGLETLEVGQTYTDLYLPKTITLSSAITSITNIFFSTGTVMTATHFVRLTKTAINFYRKSGFSGTTVNTVKYTSTDGITYTRTDSLAETLTVAEIYQNEYSSITVQEANVSILQQMFLSPSKYFGGLYAYTENGYTNAPTQLDATAEYVAEKEFYGKNGVGTGTLQTNTDLSNTEIVIKAKLWDSLKELTPEETTTSFSRVFMNYTGESIPMIDTSNISSMSYMFYECPNLKTIPLLNTENVTDMTQMFYGCSSLEEIPLLNTSNVTTTQYMFRYCANLKSVPALDTSKVVYFTDMFEGCSALEDVPVFDAGVAGNMGQMFKDCPLLTDESLNNILLTCTNSAVSGNSLGHIGLTQAQATRCTTLSNYEAFIAAGWRTGY